jgi:long-chain acyl-CoA synthetase
MPNTPETIILYYALNKIGAIAHMLDPRLPAEEIKTRINQMNSEALFFLDADPLTKALSEFDFISETTLKKAISISPKISMPPVLKTLYTLLLERKSTHIQESNSITNWDNFINSGDIYKEEIPNIYIKNEPVVIIHTGGTTGTPKGAVHSNENFNAIASKYRGTRNHARQTEVLSMAPMFHILGIGASIHVALSNGLIADLMPKFTPQIMINTLKKGKTNHIICITAVLTFLMKNPKIKRMDLSNLGFIISGGDYISPELEKGFNDFLKTVNSPAKLDKGFGLTEGGLAIFSKGEANMYGGIGIPLVNTDIKFVNPETNEEVGYGEKGEMCLHGFAMLRYHNNPEETDIALRVHDDGIKWLHTGDIGHITENGIVCFDDRIKQIIITNGQNVYPSEIEKIIVTHPAIQECVVLGIPDDKKGEIPKAYIILKADVVADESVFIELINMCKKKLAPYAVPYVYKVKTEFPKTLMNKIDKKALLDEETFLSKAPTLYDMRKRT